MIRSNLGAVQIYMAPGFGCESYMSLRNGDWLVLAMLLKIVSYEMKDENVG